MTRNDSTAALNLVNLIDGVAGPCPFEVSDYGCDGSGITAIDCDCFRRHVSRERRIRHSKCKGTGRIEVACRCVAGDAHYAAGMRRAKPGEW